MMYLTKFGERIFNALTFWKPTSSNSNTVLSRKRDYTDFDCDVDSDSDEELELEPPYKRIRINGYDQEDDAVTRSGTSSLQNKRIFKSWLTTPIRTEKDLKWQQVKQRDPEYTSPTQFLLESAMANKENLRRNKTEIKCLGFTTKVPTPDAKSFLDKIDPSFKFNPKLTSTVQRDSLVRSRKPYSFPRSQIYEKKNYFSFKNSHQMKPKRIPRFSTASQCIQLGEKSIYKQLIDQHTSSDLSIKTSNKPALFITHLNPKYTSKKREFFENLEKNGTSYHVEVTNPIKCSSNSSLLKNKSSEIPLIDLSEEEFTSKDYKDDDEVLVTKVIKSPEKRRNALEEKFLSSEFYHDDFFQNRKAEDIEKEKFVQKALEKPFKIIHEREKFRLTTFNEHLDKITKGLEVLNTEYPKSFTELPDEEEEVELPELTNEALLVIERAFKGGPINQVLAEKFNIQITRKDIRTLHGLNWLNDEIINFYMNLIVERSQKEKIYPSVYAFNTFFYSKLIKTGYKSVQRWTKKIDIFAHNLLLIPVHLGMHWCLATIDFRSKTIRYYDSMLGDNYKCLEELRRYLDSEHQDKKKSSYEESSLLTTINVKDIPQQMNGSDCGMFSCKFAEYLSRNAPISFTQENMPYFRNRMVYEIVTNKLMRESLKPYK